MNGISTGVAIGGVSSGFVIMSDTLNRKLPFGSNWTRVRIGLRGMFPTTGTVPTAGSAPFFFGLDSSGAEYGFPNQFLTDATGVRALGLLINEPNGSGSSPLHFDPNASGNTFIDQHGSTVDFSVQLGASPRLVGSGANLTVMLLEFTKGASDISVQMAYQNAASAVTTANFDASMAAANMEAALAILGGTYSLVSQTVTGAIARNQYGELDRLCISSAASVNFANSSTCVPVIQNLSTRRLY